MDSSKLQITYHEVKPSAALSRRISQEADKLEEYFDGIVSCRVVVDRPHLRHHRKGSPFELHIEIGVPRGTVVVHHQPSERRIIRKEGIRRSKRLDVVPERRDPYVAVRDAFDAAARRLEDYARRLRERRRRSDDAGPPGRL